VSDPGSNGLLARTSANTTTARSLAVSGTGLSVSNADGVAANPTVTSNATNANTASTLVARDASGNFAAGTITAALTGNVTGNTSGSAGSVATTNWTFSQSGTDIVASYNGTRRFKVDASGNAVVSGNVTAYGTV
jgi:hypothetical protein